MSPFQYGIDFGAIGGLQAMPGFLQVFGHPDPSLPVGYNISTERQQLISSLMMLGAFLSSSCAGVIATKLGRKHCLWMASTLCCVSNIVMITTKNIAGLYMGRLMIGIANGWFMTFSQLYIQVCSTFLLNNLKAANGMLGISTSPLPWSHDLHLPNLDLHR
jgi:SP family sugar:H+ symporter-like MFS transporter